MTTFRERGLKIVWTKLVDNVFSLKYKSYKISVRLFLGLLGDKSTFDVTLLYQKEEYDVK